MSSEEDLPIHDGRTIPDVPPVPKEYIPKEIAQEQSEPLPHEAPAGPEDGGRSGAPAAESKKGSTQARRRVGASSTDLGKPRRGRTEKLVQEAKDAKPPSKVGRAIKKALLLLIPALIVGLTVAGFFVKNHDGDTVWAGILKKFGLMKSTEKKKDVASKAPCPEVVAFNSVVGICEMAEDIAKNTRSQLEDRPEWTKEQAEQVRARLDMAWEKIGKCEQTVEEFQVFLDGYLADYAQLQQADEAKDEAKKKELNEKLRRFDYADISITVKDVEKIRQRRLRARIAVRDLRNKFPTPEEIAKGILPKKEEPRKEEPKAFDASGLNPYAKITAGQWRRDEVVQAGALNERKFLQDVVWEEVEKQAVIVRAYVSEDGRISESPPNRQEFGAAKLLGVEKVGVGGVEYECQIVEIGPTRLWIARGGPRPDRVAVKMESEQMSLAATELGTRTLSVKGSDVSCVYVELKGKIANQDAVQRYWFSDSVPTGTVRSEYEMGDNKNSSMLVDFGEAPRPKFEGETAKTEEPKKEEPKKEEPKKKELPKQPGPWANFAEGTWVRIKSTYKEGNQISVSWKDKTLLRKGAELTFKVDDRVSTGEESTEEKTEPAEPPQPEVVGEDTITVEGADVPCLVAELDGLKMWICVEGPASGLALKTQRRGVTTTVKKIGQEQLIVQGRGFTCLYTESEDSNGAKIKEWRSAEIPHGLGRREIEKAGKDHPILLTEEVADFGDGTKPPFGEVSKKTEEPKKEEPKKEEPTKPKEKTADDFVKDGDGFLSEASRRFTEVSKACREGLPAEKDKLQPLKEKADSAETNFRAAIDAYALAKEKGADGAKMDDKVTRIQRLLGLHKRNQEAIEKKIAE